MNDEEQWSPEDEWQCRSTAVVHQFGLSLQELHESNPWPEFRLLPNAMNTLMTELWDRGFSQTEIREAFNRAIADMPRYTAGVEARFGGGEKARL
jgi:hypothetical protein